MKETVVETVEKQEVGAEDTPFLRELSDDTDTPLDELEDAEFDELFGSFSVVLILSIQSWIFLAFNILLIFCLFRSIVIVSMKSSTTSCLPVCP
jgi:hypothetical protein